MKLLRTILLTSAAICSVYTFTGCQESKTAKADPKPVVKSPQPKAAAAPSEKPTLSKATATPSEKPAPSKTDNAAAITKPVKPPVNAAETKGRPRIVFEKTSHNFGIMGPGKNYHTEYKFKNAGTGEFIIKRINSPCGCTVPELKKRTMRRANPESSR